MAITWQPAIGLTIVIVLAEQAVVFLVACLGSAPLKKHLEGLFAVKAPATVLGIGWNMIVIHTLQAAVIGSADGTMEELDPDVTPNDVRGWVVKSGSSVAFIALCLIMTCIIRIINKLNFPPSWTSLMIGAFKMTPGWAFKSIVTDVIANLDKYLSDDPVWAYHTAYALVVLLICTAASAVLPGLKDGQSYCAAVLGLAAASLACGVAYSFDLVFSTVFEDRWADLGFQLVYTPLMTILCLMFAIYFHHHDLKSDNAFMQNLAKFLKIIPGFVAAWAWSELMTVVAQKVWKEPDDDKDQALRDSILAGAWGILAIILIGLSLALQNCCTSENEIVTEVFTNIGGCNIGWAWKNAATDVFNAMGGKLLDQWIVTVGLSVVVPIMAACLLCVINFTNESGEEEYSELEQIEMMGREISSLSASEPMCGFCHQHEVDDSDEEKDVVIYPNATPRQS